MGVNRRAAKRDSNERPIIDALHAAGCSVQQLSVKGVPDLLVGFQGHNYLMEVKDKTGKLTPDETIWIGHWDGQVRIVRSIEDALKVINRE